MRYLHVNGLHEGAYTDVNKLIADMTKHVLAGDDVHIQTREQWLTESDKYAEALEKAYQCGKENK